MPVVDVPVTLSGLSAHNIANALAGGGRGPGPGPAARGRRRGAAHRSPRTPAQPRPDEHLHAAVGRRRAVTVIVDLAHNEAGLEALLRRRRRAARRRARRCTSAWAPAGDRTDEILQALGEIAGRRADHVVAAHKAHYLRGRTMEDLEAQLRIGLARVGVGEVDVLPDTELEGLQAMVADRR